MNPLSAMDRPGSARAARRSAPRARGTAPASLLALALAMAGTSATADDLPNYITLSAGGSSVNGSSPAFTGRLDRPTGFIGGVENFHFEKWLDSGAFFAVDGRALAEAEDYRVAIEYSMPDRYSFSAGFEQFRLWSSAVSIAIPGSTFWSNPFDPELYLDRSKLWFEARIGAPDRPQFHLRYTRLARNGSKPSTHWGDTSLAGGTPNIVPAFRDIDDVRHEVLLDVIFRPATETRYTGGLRWQVTDTNGRLQSRRRPGEAADRHVTHREDLNTDLFSVHGSAERQINDKLRLTAGANWTTLSGTMSMDRIYGDSYNPVFDPVFANRQQRDHGVINLDGRSDLRQFITTFGALYTPVANLVITPSVRYERTYRTTFSDYIDTEVANVGGSLVTELHDSAAESRRDYNLFTGAIQGRYTGIRNWTLTAGVTASRGTGNLDERGFDMEPATPALTLDRNTRDTRTTFQADLGAHWRITPAVRVSFGARQKYSDNDYGIVRDSTSNNTTGGDRYPSYIESQTFRTTTVNARLHWRVNPRLTSISRVDFQSGTTSSRTFHIVGLASRDYERLVLSQSLAYQPLNRLFVQASVNAVSDLMRTPANTAPGQPRHGLVTESDQGYSYGQVSAFYAVSDDTDLTLTYQFCLVDAYVNNYPTSIPLGPDLDEHTATARLTHRFSERVLITFDYAFRHADSLATAGHTHYDAHLFGTRLQYRF